MELKTSKIISCVNNHILCKDFLQRMMNRLSVGHHRYGEGNKENLYAKRMEGALRRYKFSGNQEYLFDAANYAILEYIYPSHKNAHHKDLDSNGRNFIP